VGGRRAPDAMSAPDPPKRQTARIQPFVVPCRYAVGETRVPGYLSDISSRGGRVHIDAEPPPVGATLLVEVRLRSLATPLPVPATVRWARPSERGGFVFGCSFDAVGAEEQKVLDAVVAEFQRRAASIG
jgi:hypothetical protein